MQRQFFPSFQFLKVRQISGFYRESTLLGMAQVQPMPNKELIFDKELELEFLSANC